ncbi:MAG: helix-turn-helix domain-containing protein [Ruminococcaceae bacterium]|nr:helix-turn-helix domain-containing protein [Oscillospiraceae bacterium]
MSHILENVQITGIIRGNSTVQAHITSRPSHMLIYKVNGESIYYLRGTQMRLSEGSVLYIPEGERYSFKKTSDGDSVYYLVNFHCSTPLMEKPKLFYPQSPEHIIYIFNQMQKHWMLSHNDTDRYELHSLFYHLISVLLQPQSKPYRTSAQSARLDNALAHLEEHLYSHELCVSELAQMCGISEVTFRSLFTSKLGEPPKKYIIRCRMMRAKAIIESGEYGSIAEVAKMVGYEDALYFSKHFKSFFGYPPSKIQ